MEAIYEAIEKAQRIKFGFFEIWSNNILNSIVVTILMLAFLLVIAWSLWVMDARRGACMLILSLAGGTFFACASLTLNVFGREGAIELIGNEIDKVAIEQYPLTMGYLDFPQVDLEKKERFFTDFEKDEFSEGGFSSCFGFSKNKNVVRYTIPKEKDSILELNDFNDINAAILYQLDKKLHENSIELKTRGLSIDMANLSIEGLDKDDCPIFIKMKYGEKGIEVHIMPMDKILILE